MSETPDAIDMITLARFSVLPGAARLLAAYSEIPPGRLREAFILQAEALAEQYRDERPLRRMDDPLAMAAALLSEPPVNGHAALPAPGQRRPVNTNDPGVRAVDLRMQGWAPPRIAAELAMGVAEVQAALKDARAAGLRFPAVEANPDRKIKAFHVERGSADGRAIASMEGAALRLGLDLDSYFARRKMLVELRRKNTPIEELAAALHPVPEKTIWAWIAQARRSGFDIPARLDFDEAEFEDAVTTGAARLAAATARKPKRRPTPSVAPVLGKVFTPPDSMKAGARAMALKAAARCGLTLRDYCDTRESVVIHRADGKDVGEIARITGFGPGQVQSVISQAIQRGMVFPALSQRSLQPAT